MCAEQTWKKVSIFWDFKTIHPGKTHSAFLERRHWDQTVFSAAKQSES